MPKRQRMIKVPLRLGPRDLTVLADMQQISRLSGYSVQTVISILMTVGFLRDYRVLAAGLRAHIKKDRPKR